MTLNPSQFRLLLAGPKVSRLMPFVTQRGYYADGCVTGSETLELLRQSPRHVLLVELELEDMMLADLIQTVRRESLVGAILLLEDPAKSGLIVSALVRGVDGYVATPPDEQYLFRIIERQLLAQLAVAQMAKSEEDAADKARLEKQVLAERAKVTSLVKEIAGLREQLNAARKSAGNSMMDVPDTQLVMAKKPGRAPIVDDDEDDFEEAVTLRAARAVATHMRSDVNTANLQQPPPDERTSPAGYSAPPELRGDPSRSGPGGSDTGFDDAPHTRPSTGDEEHLAGELDGELDDDDPDLFLELEDPTIGDNAESLNPTVPTPAPKRR